MTPIVPTRPGAAPPDKSVTRDGFRPTPPQARRELIAMGQGFASYWHKRCWLLEHPEDQARYDGRRRQGPPPPLSSAA